MKHYSTITLLLVLLLLGLLSFSVAAQDSQLSCNGGPNDVLIAAQAAYDAGQFDAALALVAQAETLCEGNRVSLRQARALGTRIEQEIEIELAEPGIVNIGDYTLFMTCFGEGSPTVIFENGFGQTHNQWNAVAPTIAQTTRSCTYDRLGYGYSDPFPADIIRTTQDQVDDLISLLEIAEIEGPYILIGHSGTGMNLRLFADQYPDMVAGLVMVDTLVPGIFDDRPTLLNEIRSFSMNMERLDLDTSLEQVSNLKELGNLPLVVISNNLQFPIPQTDWIELQADYATYSTNSQFIIAEHSGHFVMDSEPELIVDAIFWILDQEESIE